MNRRPRTALVALVPMIVLVGCEEPVPEKAIRPVRCMKVQDLNGMAEASFPGRAKATEETNLSFRVAGPLVARPVKVGDQVKKGDIVARIDPRDFEVNLRNVAAQLEKTKARLDYASKEYERAQRIFKEDPGAISEVTIDQRLEERDRMKAEVKSLEAAVDSAADKLSYTTLKAPRDSIVVATFVENFEYVQAQQAIARLLDQSKIEMWIDVPENLISNAPYVKEVNVVFDAFPDREIPARIKEVGTEASLRTRTYPVNLIMDQPEDIKVLPGMAGRAHGTAELPPELQEAGFEIPLAALFTDAKGDSFVWMIDESSMTVKRQKVTPGSMTARGVRVQGLQPGQTIVTAGVHSLSEGEKVKILDEASLFAGR